MTTYMFDNLRPGMSLMLGHQYLSFEIDCERHAALGVSGFFRLDFMEGKTLEK